MRNTIAGHFLVEDTKRYLLQKRCLQMLSDAGNLRVIYRPHPMHGQERWGGTVAWLRRSRCRSIGLSRIKPLDALIRECDVVISDTSSGTVWNEVLALKKPFILYCDPEQTPLAEPFQADLESACYWCKSDEALVDAVARLAREREAFIEVLGKADSHRFIRNYVLYRDDGQCAKRVTSFLNDVCRYRMPLDDWFQGPSKARLEQQPSQRV